MTFRQHNNVKPAREFGVWLDSHRTALKAIGLSPNVYVSLDHWTDFLNNGSLDHHEDPSFFSFEQLNLSQQKALLRFLMREEQACPVMEWLKVRFPEVVLE